MIFIEKPPENGEIRIFRKLPYNITFFGAYGNRFAAWKGQIKAAADGSGERGPKNIKKS